MKFCSKSTDYNMNNFDCNPIMIPNVFIAQT